MRQKRDKADVDYSRGKPTSKCATCEHFQAPDRCERVSGVIDPNYWCELYQRGSMYEAMTRRNAAPPSDYKLMSRKKRMQGRPKPPGTF